jgi:hypothetical protein
VLPKPPGKSTLASMAGSQLYTVAVTFHFAGSQAAGVDGGAAGCPAADADTSTAEPMQRAVIALPIELTSFIIAALYLLDCVEGFGMTCSTMNPLPVGK